MNNEPGAGAGSAPPAMDGGHGEVTAWSDPMLVLTAPGGVVATTPASTTLAAGNTAVLIASQAVEHFAQENHATVVKHGMVLYTVGRPPTRPSRTRKPASASTPPAAA